MRWHRICLNHFDHAKFIVNVNRLCNCFIVSIQQAHAIPRPWRLTTRCGILLRILWTRWHHLIHRRISISPILLNRIALIQSILVLDVFKFNRFFRWSLTICVHLPIGIAVVLFQLFWEVRLWVGVGCLVWKVWPPYLSTDFVWFLLWWWTLSYIWGFWEYDFAFIVGSINSNLLSILKLTRPIIDIILNLLLTLLIKYGATRSQPGLQVDGRRLSPTLLLNDLARLLYWWMHVSWLH